MRKYFSLIFFIPYPASSGYIHASSGEDASAAPDFDVGYITKEEDLELLRWGYKRSREFARRMPSYRGEYADWHPKFPEGSEAAAKGDVDPVPFDAPNLKWTAEDDKAIDKYIQEYGE